MTSQSGAALFANMNFIKSEAEMKNDAQNQKADPSLKRMGKIHMDHLGHGRKMFHYVER